MAKRLMPQHSIKISPKISRVCVCFCTIRVWLSNRASSSNEYVFNAITLKIMHISKYLNQNKLTNVGIHIVAVDCGLWFHNKDCV